MNRKLAALSSFCEFHARHGVPLGGLMVTMRPAVRRGRSSSYKPFLEHIAKSRPQRARTIRLRQPVRRPSVLSAEDAQVVLDGCEHLRDRLLFALLLDTGLRIGEALGLRHEDIALAERRVSVIPRLNANRVRAKAGRSRGVPTSAELMRLYADYLNREYGALDSDYVFVNLWGRPHGRPLTYSAVYDLVVRLRRRTGIDFEPHQFRHTFATRLINRDVPQEVVRVLLDHDSHQMTAHYARITDQTVRRRWEAATKVNIQGERVTLDPGGPPAQAEWAKTRYGLATQTLPNGYCGLPVQKTCPHANACLTCPVFLTGPEFLPELKAQRGRTLTLIDNAKGCGHQRVAEMNEQVKANLDRMIGELEADSDKPQETADAG